MAPDFYREIHDFAVIGAGIAGASVAYALTTGAAADHGVSVVVVERESQPGYHATGRSAAMFMESYGTLAVRQLTRASRAFYASPPQDFAAREILTPRGCLYIAALGQEHELQQTFEALLETGSDVHRVDAAEAMSRVPVLRAESLCGAIAEDDACDMDVHALHEGYLKGMRARGGHLVLEATLEQADRADGVWTLRFADGRLLRARTIVNAAGAWADPVAEICGARPAGIEPRRRTAFTFRPPEGVDSRHWPTVISVDETFYFKPDAGQLLGSPANADPVAPHDVVAEELDVAMGIYRIEEATRLQIRRPASTWAGLRSFAPDGDFVVGWDPGREGFFWLAGQGGYGIQTASATSALAAALLRGQPVPAHIAATGFKLDAVAPRRLSTLATV